MAAKINTMSFSNHRIWKAFLTLTIGKHFLKKRTNGIFNSSSLLKNLLTSREKYTLVQFEDSQL